MDSETLEQLTNIFQTILNDSNMFSNNKEGVVPKDYISDKSIAAIENNIEFFKDIPKDDLKNVLEYFVEEICNYEGDMNRYHIDIMFSMQPFVPQLDNKSTDWYVRKKQRKEKNKPSKLKADDLKTLKKYQEMLSRLFPLQACELPRVYIENSEHKDISCSYELNEKLINDLENEEFDIISRDNYHKIQGPSKTKIKDFLKKIRKKYNLQGVALDEKQLVDSIQTSTDRTLPTKDEF